MFPPFPVNPDLTMLGASSVTDSAGLLAFGWFWPAPQPVAARTINTESASARGGVFIVLLIDG